MIAKNAVAEFIANNPGSTVAMIAAGIGIEEAKVRKAISNYNMNRADHRIVVCNMIGANGCYELKKPAVMAAMPEKESPEVGFTPVISPKEKAAQALAAYVGDQLRSDFDAALASILPRVVESALSGITSDIRAAIVSAFGPAPAAEEIPLPVVAPAPVKAPAAIEPTKEIPAPVVNVLSTRTKHREKTKPAAVESEVIQIDRKRKVVVVGLHSNKQEFIRREFRECFDLRIFTPDQLRATQECTHAGDLAFLMADFVSHKHQDALDAAGAQVVIVHGGISSLREAMTKAFIGEDKAA